MSNSDPTLFERLAKVEPAKLVRLLVELAAQDQTILKQVQYRNIGRTEPYTRHEHRHMNDDENKPADKEAPRGISDELVDGDTLDVTDDPSKEEEEPLEPHDKPS